MARQTIRLAHSPDSDDAFMFYALATDKIETDEFDFVHELHDIETLNHAALEGTYEVSAVSIHGFAFIADRYALLNSGASMGEGYGPKLVSRKFFDPSELASRTVAVPGLRTSAYLALKLFHPAVVTEVVPFDEIIPHVREGKSDAGVIIHEGQLTYRDEGLQQVLDLGEWWLSETGLPLPLGGNVIRKDLGRENIERLGVMLRESIEFSLAHREEALNYALQFGRGLDSSDGDRFVSMYVNERTVDYGDSGRSAVQLFLDRGHQAGIIPHSIQVEFVG